MKVIIVTPEYPKMLGGVGDYTYNLSKSLVAIGVEVFVLTVNDKRVIKENDINLLNITSEWNIFTLPKIISVVKSIAPSLVSLQYTPNGYSRIGVPLWLIVFSLYLYFHRITLVTTFHEISVGFGLNPKYFFTGLMQRLINYVLAFCSKRVIVAVDYWKKLLSDFQKKIICIPVGSNIIPYNIPIEEKINLRKTVAPNNDLIISTFGSTPFYRRHDLVLKAISKITNQHKDVALKIVFIGYSQERSKLYLQQVIKELDLKSQVFFTGYLENKDVYNYLSISDIFVLLHVDNKGSGGIGMKSGSVAAAYAAGLPTIGFCGNATDDIFLNNENVYFVKSISVDDIANAIFELIKDKELRIKLSKGAKETYKQYLDWNVLAERYKDVFTLASL